MIIVLLLWHVWDVGRVLTCCSGMFGNLRWLTHCSLREPKGVLTCLLLRHVGLLLGINHSGTFGHLRGVLTC